jgi:hypothetical protein
MITLKEYFELIEYKITESNEYLWRCFGNDAQSIDSWNGDYEGYNIGITFDRKNQTVYLVEVCDYKRNRAYRLINPDFTEQFRAESKIRDIDDMAWDNVKWTDLETEEDLMNKATAIKNDKDYDTRITIPLDLSDNELFYLMQQAHEKDITLNKFVEQLLQAVIDKENGKTESAKKETTESA